MVFLLGGEAFTGGVIIIQFARTFSSFIIKLYYQYNISKEKHTKYITTMKSTNYIVREYTLEFNTTLFLTKKKNYYDNIQITTIKTLIHIFEAEI